MFAVTNGTGSLQVTSRPSGEFAYEKHTHVCLHMKNKTHVCVCVLNTLFESGHIT